MIKAQRLFAAQDWEGAAREYASAIGPDTNDPRGWFEYGYSLYRLERDQEALDAYERAEQQGYESPRLSGTAAICAARLGRDDVAIELLRHAVELGMPPGPLQTTEAFDRLRDRADFRAIEEAARAAAFPCPEHEKSRQFDFWIGEWTVEVGGQPLGENVIENRLEGCLIHEHYTSSGGLEGSSINFYDPEIDGWRQIWLDNSGDVTRYEGHLEGVGMVFEGRRTTRSGAVQPVRMRFTPNPDGSLRQLIEAGMPDGSWQITFDGTYSRQNP